MNTNIKRLTVFRDRGTWGYSVKYKSGRSKSDMTGNVLVLPDTLRKFMINSPYSVPHTDGQWLDVVYYDSRPDG